MGNLTMIIYYDNIVQVLKYTITIDCIVVLHYIYDMIRLICKNCIWFWENGKIKIYDRFKYILDLSYKSYYRLS